MEYEMGKACSTHGGVEKCLHNFSMKSCWEKSLERLSECRMENNIKFDLKEIGCDVVD
jgi:hypothetical protein